MTRAWLLGLCAVAVAACGSSSSGTPAAATQRLQPDMRALRSALIAGDGPGATRRLANVLSDTETLRKAGTLSGAAADRIVTAAVGLQTQLDTYLTTTTTTTTTTAPSVGPGHGKGKGNQQDGGD